MSHVKNPKKQLAVVNVHPKDDGRKRVEVCMMPDPDTLVGERQQSRAVLALDASKSLKPAYGDAFNPNHMEPVALKIGELLGDVTRDDSVSLFYWALEGGSDLEDIGTFKGADLEEVSITGPGHHRWGKGTYMLPAIRKIVEEHGQGAVWIMGVVVTDGIIEDEAACMEYCMELGRQVAANPDRVVKLVLIGVGTHVDRDQLLRFDDMFEDTELEEKVDVWASGWVENIKEPHQITGILFGELMTPEMIVAPSGEVRDDRGNVLDVFADGLPGKFSFSVHGGCNSFTLKIEGLEIEQDISPAALT